MSREKIRREIVYYLDGTEPVHTVEYDRAVPRTLAQIPPSKQLAVIYDEAGHLCGVVTRTDDETQPVVLTETPSGAGPAFTLEPDGLDGVVSFVRDDGGVAVSTVGDPQPSQLLFCLRCPAAMALEAEAVRAALARPRTRRVASIAVQRPAS